MELINKFWKDQEGPTATEYALLAGLIALVIVIAVTALGISVSGVFSNELLNDTLGTP
jgi:pilus assembly protein Flp/PilA